MYMYGEADFKANKAMQEPLEKLYQYEDQPDMRGKVIEYIGELETEIKRLEEHLESHTNDITCITTEIISRMETLQEVINDLKGRLEERV